MINNETIQEAAFNHSLNDYTECYEDYLREHDFVSGINWFDNNLLHSSNETPSIGTTILYEWEDEYTGEISVDTLKITSNVNWDTIVNEWHCHSWIDINDLMRKN